MTEDGMPLVHLTRAYRLKPRADDWRATIPLAACDLRGTVPASEQVSPWHDPSAEKLITCPECVAWLADEDNRLLYYNTDEWIRKHCEAGDRDFWYMDIPVEDS